MLAVVLCLHGHEGHIDVQTSSRCAVCDEHVTSSSRPGTADLQGKRVVMTLTGPRGNVQTCSEKDEEKEGMVAGGGGGGVCEKQRN